MAEESTVNETSPQIDLSGQAEKPRLLALLFADYAEITQSGKAVIAGVFDRLFYQAGIPAAFYIYARLARSIQSQVTITVLSPRGVPIAEMILRPPEVIPPSSRADYMHVATRVAMGFEEPGLYWFDVSYMGERLGLVPVDVDMAPEVSDGPANS